MIKQRVLVTGASGKLGPYVVRELLQRGREVVAWSGTQEGTIEGIPLRSVDLRQPAGVREAFLQAEAPLVIHCAAVSAIAQAYSDFPLALLVNRDATALLGELSSRLIYTSTDLVFDGTKAPYGESAIPAPSSRYGESKLEGERALLDQQGCLSCRMSLMYGPSLFGSKGFFEHQLDKLAKGEHLALFKDEWRTPLALDEAARALVELLDSPREGLIHLGGPERLSRYEMGLMMAGFLGVSTDLVRPTIQSSVAFPEARPADVSLESRFVSNPGLSSFEEGLKRLMSQEKSKDV